MPRNGCLGKPLARSPLRTGSSAGFGARFQPGAGRGDDLSHPQSSACRGTAAVAVGRGRGGTSPQVLRTHPGRARPCHPHGRDMDAILRRTRLLDRAGIARQKRGAELMTPETQVNDYLARLRASLIGMTVSEREDIVEEIHMHIRERSSDPRTTLDAVLAGL